jgi:hypothetical protein
MIYPCHQFCTSLVVLAILVSPIGAGERQILHSKAMSRKLEAVVELLRNPKGPTVPYDKLTRATAFFVRIVPRRHVLTEKGELRDDAVLSSKPLTFLTTPDSVRGKSLLVIYEDIGYEAREILRRRNADMVAVVFRYPDAVKICHATDGDLPGEWNDRVFVPTWANAFSLFKKLAEGATVEVGAKSKISPSKLFFRSEAEKHFVQSFPEEGQRRIRSTSYVSIKAAGGADWEYRKLLEEKLSLHAHFRGNGRTHNTIRDPDGLHPEAGMIEFLGPNMHVKDLPEFTIVHLGRLVIEDSYSTERVVEKE